MFYNGEIFFTLWYFGTCRWKPKICQPRRLTQNFGAKKILLSEFCARRKGCRQIHVERVSDLVGLAARTLHKIDQITPAQGLPEIHKKYQYFSRTNIKTWQKYFASSLINIERSQLDLDSISIQSIQKIGKGLGKREWFMLYTQNKKKGFVWIRIWRKPSELKILFHVYLIVLKLEYFGIHISYFGD